MRKGRETDNNRRRVHMQGKLFLDRQRYEEGVKMCASHRLRKNDGEGQRKGTRERERDVVPSMGKALVASLVVCLDRHPASLGRIHHPLLHSFARVCNTTARERYLCPSPSLLTSRSFLRPLTPSPRGEGRRNASKNPSN